MIKQNYNVSNKKKPVRHEKNKMSYQNEPTFNTKCVTGLQKINNTMSTALQMYEKALLRLTICSQSHPVL